VKQFIHRFEEIIKIIPSEKAGDVAMLILEKGAHKFLEE
jgi:hypothetical protein